MTQKTGTLFLIPVTLGPSVQTTHVIPNEVITTAHRIKHFVAENAKNARASLKLFAHPCPLREIHIAELNQHTPEASIAELLRPLHEGHDMGLMSDAGCPAVADPGSALVQIAHQQGIRITPLVGPSSILLALMASGMNGQRFSFHGYLPAKTVERQKALTKLETESRTHGGVEIFIETPYRNEAMLEAALQLSPKTRLCIACDLTLPTESIRSARISDWKKTGRRENYSDRPAIFLLQA